MVEGVVSGAGLNVDFAIERSDRFRLELAMSIAGGETVALLGPNGAGKSTAVDAIAGLLSIDNGRIVLNDVSLDEPELSVFVPASLRSVGVVFQDYLLFPHLSVIENIAFGLRSHGVTRPMALKRAEEWIERVGLADHGSARPGDLSGGQAQRVALARALITEPDMLLLDEPLSALDVTTRSELRHTIRVHLEEFPGPRLLITHDPTEAFLLADKIHVIENGAVTQTGTPDDIRLRPRTPYAADLAGSNLLEGVAKSGNVDAGGHFLRVPEDSPEGAVLLVIQPAAISVHARQPEGSPRNAWRTIVDQFERLGSRIRLRTGAPLPLTVEVTASAAEELGLSVGTLVWISIKATEIGVQEDHRGLPGPG